jgi:hypothetical protein
MEMANTDSSDPYNLRKDAVFYESNQEPDAESARVVAGSKSLFLSLPQELLILVAQLIQRKCHPKTDIITCPFRPRK